MQPGWLLCQPFIFVQTATIPGSPFSPVFASLGMLFAARWQSSAACFLGRHCCGCESRHDNRSLYFFSCSPTVHCRMQNWWAYFFPRVFRKCDFKKQPSQYVFNILSTSRMSCFLSIFIPSFSPPAFPSALRVRLFHWIRRVCPGIIPLSKFPPNWGML